MKQTVEEAAMNFANYESNNLDKLPFKVKNVVDYDNGLTRGFKTGAEWQAKQFPWISVEERLPETKDEVLVLNRMKRSDKYFVSENCYTNGDWAAKSAMYYEEIAWMPIPSFDEILEANKDVLKRIN